MEDAPIQLGLSSFSTTAQLLSFKHVGESLSQRLDMLQDPVHHRGYPTIFPVSMSDCGNCNELSRESGMNVCGQDVAKLRQELERAQQRISQLQVEKLEVYKELERKEQLLEEARRTEDRLREQLRSRNKSGETQAAAAAVCKAVNELLCESATHEAGLKDRLGLKDQDVVFAVATADDVSKKVCSTMSTLLMQASSELAAERQHHRSMHEKLTALQSLISTLQAQQPSQDLPCKNKAAKTDDTLARDQDDNADADTDDDNDVVEHANDDDDDNLAVGREDLKRQTEVYPEQERAHDVTGLLDSEMRSSSGTLGSSLKGEVVYHTNAFAQLEQMEDDCPLLQELSDTDDDDFWERDAALHAQLLDLSQLPSAGSTPRAPDSAKENMSRLSGGQFQSLTELLGMAKAVDMRLSANSNPWAHAPLTSRGRPIRPYKTMRDFAGVNISNIVSNSSMFAAAQLSARSWAAGDGMKGMMEPGSVGFPTPRSARSNTSSSDRSQDDSIGSSEGSKGTNSQESAQDAQQRRERWEQEEKRLLGLLPKPMGFHNGRPLAALAVFYSCLRWRTFQTGRTSLMDKIVQIISNMIDQHQGDNTMLAYWLTNTATLWHLLHKSIKPPGAGQRAGQQTKSAGIGKGTQAGATGGQLQVEATYPTLVFKQQLDAHVQKIFPLICANVKKQISSQLSSSANNQSDDATGNLPWSQMLQAFDELLKTLQQQYVPKGLVRALFKQLFSYVNVQQFNQLLLRRDSCCYSHGQSIESGLKQLDEWVAGAGAEWVASAVQDLDYIRQAVEFLILPNKASKTFADISSVCPALSVNQLYRLATMFWDDQSSTGSLSADVVQQMKQQLVSGQSGSHAFLLDADTMLTVQVEDVLKMLNEKDFQFETAATTAKQQPATGASSAPLMQPLPPAQAVH